MKKLIPKLEESRNKKDHAKKINEKVQNNNRRDNETELFFRKEK